MLEGGAAGRTGVLVVVVGGVASLAALGAGVALYEGEHVKVVMIFGSIATAAWLLTVTLLLVARRFLGSAPGATTSDRLTGAVLGPVNSRPCGSAIAVQPGSPIRWLGGANVPSGFGRLNASTPLAALLLAGGTLSLQLRPRIVGRALLAKPLLVHPHEGASVFPVRGRLGGRGIGIALGTQPEWYFWTRDREEILALLARAGFDVGWEELRTRFF